MVDSRKFAPDSPAFASLTAALAQSLASLPAREPVAVALSGGADSSALALIAAHLCKTHSRPVYLFHIHHGLYDQADDWQQRVETFSKLIDVPLVVKRVQVHTDSGKGIEAAARLARYQAFVEMASECGVKTLLLAHHRQDQAETVLFRLLRGAGVQGLTAMRDRTEREGLVYLRPWLDIDRDDLLALVADFSLHTGWLPVADPSNTDPQFARGALRKDILPAIQAHWPAWKQTLVRHARQASEAVQIMDEVAASDLAQLDLDSQDHSFSLQLWRLLSEPRQSLVLRFWLQQHGVAMPGERKLADLIRQLRQLHQLGTDRDLLWHHDPYVVRCHKGRVRLESSSR